MNDHKGRHAMVLAAHQPLLAKHNASWRILILAVMAVAKTAGFFSHVRSNSHRAMVVQSRSAQCKMSGREARLPGLSEWAVAL